MLEQANKTAKQHQNLMLLGKLSCKIHFLLNKNAKEKRLNGRFVEQKADERQKHTLSQIVTLLVNDTKILLVRRILGENETQF